MNGSSSARSGFLLLLHLLFFYVMAVHSFVTISPWQGSRAVSCNRRRPSHRNMARHSAPWSLYSGPESPWLSVKRSLRITYIQRKRTQEALQSIQKSVSRQCINFSHGALHVIVNFDDVVLHSTLPSILCQVAVRFLAKNLFVVYRLYWMALNSLFYLSEAYNVAARTACASVGVPTAVTILLSVLLPLSLLDSLLPGESMVVVSTLLPTAFNVAKAVKFSDLSVTCLFAPFQEEVFYRLIPGLIVASLFRRRILHNENLSCSSENKTVRGVFAFFSILFGAAHIGNCISLGTALADTSLSTILSTTGTAVSAGLFAAHSLVPLYRRRGFAGAVGTHVAWNTLVSFCSTQLFLLFLITALARFIRKGEIFNGLKRWINSQFILGTASVSRLASRSSEDTSSMHLIG